MASGTPPVTGPYASFRVPTIFYLVVLHAFQGGVWRLDNLCWLRFASMAASATHRGFTLRGTRPSSRTSARHSARCSCSPTFPRRGQSRPLKAQKYKSPQQWHTAIQEKVLAKETRLSADDETIAYWLGISSTTMYRLMAHWGPSTLEDLRNGKL